MPYSRCSRLTLTPTLALTLTLTPSLALLQALTPGSHQATLRAPAIDLTSLGDVLMSLMERCLTLILTRTQP